MNDAKPWYQSKTIIIALLQLAGTCLTAYLTSNPTWAYGGIAKTALDILIRLNTNSSVGGAS